MFSNMLHVHAAKTITQPRMWCQTYMQSGEASACPSCHARRGAIRLSARPCQHGLRTDLTKSLHTHTHTPHTTHSRTLTLNHSRSDSCLHAPPRPHSHTCPIPTMWLLVLICIYGRLWRTDFKLRFQYCVWCMKIRCICMCMCICVMYTRICMCMRMRMCT